MRSAAAETASSRLPPQHRGRRVHIAQETSGAHAPPHLDIQLTYCTCPNDHSKAKDKDASREGTATGCHNLFALLQSPFPR